LIQRRCRSGSEQRAASEPLVVEGEEMDFWDILQYGAWLVAGLLVLWMVLDAVRISRRYSEDVLTSSQEGIDELAMQQEQHQSGR
jgi:flagellar biosynthesis/type III secretory pathway M-ring protein FliF/YscJ